MIGARIAKAFGDTLKPSFETIRFFPMLMIPVSFGVLLLDKSGILGLFARYTAPLMGFLGLPGEAALVFLTSIFLNIFSAIAVIETLSLGARDMIILATLCCIAHNFIVEGMILKRSGSKFYRIALLRLFSGIAAAFVLNLILPHPPPAQEAAIIASASIGLDLRELPAMLIPWAQGLGLLILRMAVIILAVIFLQKILDEFGLLKILGKITSPLMRVIGLSSNSGYVWIIGNVIGLVYGSAVLIEETRSGSLSPTDADLFNHSIAVSHSQIEDSLLFAALGVPILWVVLPRFLVSIAVVWLERLRRFLFLRSFRVRVD